MGDGAPGSSDHVERAHRIELRVQLPDVAHPTWRHGACLVDAVNHARTLGLSLVMALSLSATTGFGAPPPLPGAPLRAPPPSVRHDAPTPPQTSGVPPVVRIARSTTRPSTPTTATPTTATTEDVRTGGRTAIARKVPSVPVRALLDRGLVTGDVLHHGRGRDEAGSEAMRTTARSVTDYDPNHAPNPDALKRKYDVVVSNFVLNVLPPETRQKVIGEIASVTGKVAYITVRSAGDRSIKGVREQDGVRTSIGTFQKGYTVETLRAELGAHFEDVQILMGSNKENSITAAVSRPKAATVAGK